MKNMFFLEGFPASFIAKRVDRLIKLHIVELSDSIHFIRLLNEVNAGSASARMGLWPSSTTSDPSSAARSDARWHSKEANEIMNLLLT